MPLNIDTLGLAMQVTPEGPVAPDYQTILATLIRYFRQIYGEDAYLEPDSKDGQLVALLALAIHDDNNAALAVYNAFSPATAMGQGLSSNVKINGIRRHGATHSTVDVLITGEPGTIITAGLMRDANGVQWALAQTITIPVSRSGLFTAICTEAGPVVAPPGTVSQIATPTRGWTSVTNPQTAIVGVAAETDAQLRKRQTQSVALASLTPFDALDGAIANIHGVSRHKLYENDTGSTDANGLPPHAICAIVEGGDVTEIAQVIRGKKGQGVATAGALAVNVADLYGYPHVIHFSRPTLVSVQVNIRLKAFMGYTTEIGAQIKTAVADYINSLSIGDDVLLSRVYSPANLGVVSGGNARYYDITALTLGRTTATLAAANINIAYDEAAYCSPDNIILVATA
ncbi:baseplate J/gp47 family protein [Cronobacter sakazakii]|uniref:baseplate J/gp47 family protein n=1 Tax=Cronobacter sakazakii TaxID=28141 RepID=UPI000B3DF5C0|nr:baseplate J/gp47 family protein [Cronobacter sakazakii]EIV2971412.1 baseplate J/gp47 family protein [Cronobacter sakazakii]EJQ2005485.1 baseplate J/gp47 family protein [Cronobacter sakazakii]EJQ2086599.1 baseplate J/gp47 family protein [Cronobacter sakazakii]EJR9310273.1 baseplate J/gp47 family protein [Cronobacter sakazakii]EJR9314899.1 baseplate J/gp47 family protein [Cronobacter sakazakii]